ncbi:MAG TPA: hypothetical protein VMB26_08765 [Candidatus Binataceae bacterium]|nr:hypothetical protein [Candidatus Binataceae bacterium]
MWPRLAELLPALIFGGFIAGLAACNSPSPQHAERFASAEDVQLNFQGQSFVLGDDATVALVRPVSGDANHFLRLPFWLGVNVLVPGVMQPREGDYYVISEAEIVRKLDAPDEYLIEAGSSLLKKDTIFVSPRTRYKTIGRILPTVVQFVAMRKFPKPQGGTVDLPVLLAISLPMKWTLAGQVPAAYARFEIR